MEILYWLVVKILGVIGIGGITIFLLWLLVHVIIKWVHDEKISNPLNKVVFLKKRETVFWCPTEIFIGLILLYAVSTFTWFIIVPIILIVILLYALRGFIRFKKKINTALGGKTEKEHTHEWPGNWEEGDKAKENP